MNPINSNRNPTQIAIERGRVEFLDAECFHRKRDTQLLIALLNSFAEMSIVFRTLINDELNAVTFRRSLSLVSYISVKSMVTEYVRTRSLRKVGVRSICFIVFGVLWFEIHSHRPSELLLVPS